MFGRYAHLARALRERPELADLTLKNRVTSLRVWNTVRFFVSIPLTLGLVATVVGTVANVLPGGLAQEVVDDLLRLSTSVAGASTLVFLFLSRLLGQLEIDILTRLVLEPN